MFSFAKTSKTCALFTYYHLSIAYSNLPIYISFPIQWPEGKAIDSLSPYTHARKHEIKANFKAPRNSALIGSERVTYFAAEWIKYVCIICRRVIEQILEKKPGRLQRVIKGFFLFKTHRCFHLQEYCNNSACHMSYRWLLLTTFLQKKTID